MNGRVRILNLISTPPKLCCALLIILGSAAGLRVSAQEPTSPAEMTELAHKYEKGIGCPRDIGKALVYYKRAAAEGDAAAMVALGDLYRDGICVEQDLKYSNDMYRHAAEK